MAALRRVLASLLLAVLAVGGVVLPSVHRAAHAMELQAERDAHQDTHHDGDAHAAPEAGPLATAPCPPVPHDVDCAVCAGVSVAVGAPATADTGDGTPGAALDAEVRWIQQIAAHGAGARGPPLS